jgi:hypothetical protein
LPIVSEPSAVSWAPGRIDVFAINSANLLVHAHTDDGTNWAWDDWTRPPGNPQLIGVDVVSARPGRLDIFVTAQSSTIAASTLYQKVWDNGTVIDWREWGMSSSHLYMAAPGAAAGLSSTNRLDVFAVGYDIATNPIRAVNKTLVHFFSDNGGSSVGKDDWGAGGFDLDVAKVDAASWGPNRIDIVAKAGSQIAHKWYPGGWNLWGSSGTPEIGSPPTIVSMGPGILTEFHRSLGKLRSSRYVGPPGATNPHGYLEDVDQSNGAFTPVGGVDASSW